MFLLEGRMTVESKVVGESLRRGRSLKRRSMLCVSFHVIIIKCIVYWRCDEGKGQQLTDITDNEISG